MPGPSRRLLAAVAVDARPLRHSPPFRRLFAGQLVSVIGRQVTTVAVPYQVYQQTHSPLLVGLIGGVQAVPLIAVSLAGGALADRHDRRRLLLITQSALALCSMGLLAGALAGAPPLIYIYAVVGVAAAFTAVDSPTRTAIIPNIVAADQLTGALSLNFGMFQASMIAGPALAGVVLARFGLAAAYTIDVLSFTAALLAVWSLPPQRPVGVRHGETRLRAVARGLTYVRSQPVILGGFALDLVAMIFGLPSALFPVLAARTFHVSAGGLGMLYAAPAVGALLAAGSAGWIGRARAQGRVVIICVLIWGIAITAFGLTAAFWVALLALAVAGAADSYSAVARNTMMQTLTPDELRGRLTAVYYMVVVGGPRLGDLEAGGVAAAFTPRISVVSGGLLCIAGMGIAAVAIPALWRYRAATSSPAPPLSPVEVAPEMGSPSA